MHNSSAQLFHGAGPLVICLHGFPDSIDTFSELAPLLAKAGHQVLVPVMPGYEGGSSSTAGYHYLTDVVRELVSWMDFLGEEKAHIIGHDWGAATAWLAVALFPQRFYSLTSIAIPSLKHLFSALRKRPSQLINSWYIAFFQVPKIPEIALRINQGWFVGQLWRNWSPGWQAPDHMLRAATQALGNADTRRSALAYYRGLFRFLSGENRKALKALKGPIRVPSLMVTGNKDGCIDSRLFEHCMVDRDFPFGVELYRVMGAGHFCHLEKPELVNTKVLQFLSRQSGNGNTAG